MTDEQFAKHMNTYIENLAKQEPSDWSAEARKFCEENGIISGDTSGRKMYKKYVTREEFVVMLYRAINVVIESAKKAFSK